MQNIHDRTNPRNISETANGLANVIAAAERRGEHPVVLDGMRSRLNALSRMNGDPRAVTFSFGGRI